MLKPNKTHVVPAETSRVAKAAFLKGNLYVRIRDEFGALYQDEDFAELFPDRGQPSLSLAAGGEGRAEGFGVGGGIVRADLLPDVLSRRRPSRSLLYNETCKKYKSLTELVNLFEVI